MMAVVYKNVGIMVARMAGNSSEMDRVAGELLAKVTARAVRHRLTGAYISQLSVANVPGKSGVRDRLVIAGDKAAMSIEYGHAVRYNRNNQTRNSYNFKWVPGQYILTGAINEMPGFKYNSFGRIE